jgi:predicted MFS family arabinose efflux permease
VVRSSLRRNREFLLLWSGQAVSSLGSQISQVAYPLLVLAITESPVKAGIVGFARDLPVALLALPAGVLADRLNRKHLLVACDAVRALALGAIPVGLLTGDLPYGVIVIVAAIDGAGFVVSYVAERGVLRQLVMPEQLGEAVARNESRIFGAMMAGPPLGGALFGIGRAIPFLADAVSYAFSTVTKLLISTEFQEARTDTAPAHAREGLRWLWKRPFFRTCSLLFAASNPIFTGLALLGVVLARDHGASPALVGVMLALAAGGGLVGALLAPRLQRRLTARFVLIGENVMLVLAIPWLLAVHNALLIGVILGACELITPVTNSIVVGYRIALAPDRLQGRVQAASTLISFSAGWLGPLAVGFMLTSAGSTVTILVLTGWATVLAVGATASRSFRRPPTIPAISAVVAEPATTPSG